MLLTGIKDTKHKMTRPKSWIYNHSADILSSISTVVNGIISFKTERK